MRLGLALFVTIPLLAQGTRAAPRPDPPPVEPWSPDSVDLGYRFTSIGGNNDVYRSVVNLGQGPRLLGLDFTIIDPKKRLFDRLDVRANNWGGDPYNTVHVNAVEAGHLRLSISTTGTSLTSTCCRLSPIRCSARASCSMRIPTSPTAA